MWHEQETRFISFRMLRQDAEVSKEVEVLTNHLKHTIRSQALGQSSSLPALRHPRRRHNVKSGPQGRNLFGGGEAPPPLPLPPLPVEVHMAPLGMIPPARPLPNPLSSNALGRPGAVKLLGDLLTYADTEMRARGVPKSGFSEARLAVWREVFGSIQEHLPTYRHVLLRIQHEYDGAIAALRDLVSAAESEVAKAWAQQQRVEAEQFAAKHELERELRELSKQYMRASGELRSKQSAESQLTSLLSSISSMTQPKRRETLSKLASKLSAPDRAILFHHLLAPPPGTVEPSDGRTVSFEGVPGGSGSDADKMDTRIGALLEVLPESVCSDLGVRALASLGKEARTAAIQALPPPTA